MKAIFLGSIGSVIETSDVQRQAFNRAFAAHGLDWVWDNPDYAQMLKTSGGANRIASYAKARNQTVDAAAIHRTKSALFQDVLTTSADLIPRAGVMDVLGHARANSLKTAFVSTTEAATIDAITAKLDGHTFDVVTSRDLGLPTKPAPDAFTHALETLGLKASDGIAIEDNLDGVRSAKAAGLYVIAYPGAFDDPADFTQADHVVGGSLFDAVLERLN